MAARSRTLPMSACHAFGVAIFYTRPGLGQDTGVPAQQRGSCGPCRRSGSAGAFPVRCSRGRPYRKVWFFPDERSIMTDCRSRHPAPRPGSGCRQSLIWRAFRPVARVSFRHRRQMTRWRWPPRTVCTPPAAQKPGSVLPGSSAACRPVAVRHRGPAGGPCPGHASFVNHLLQSQRQPKQFRSARQQDAQAAMLARR